MHFPLSHPAIVHVPLGLAMVMPFLAAGLTLAVWRGRLPRTAFAVVAALQLVVVGAGYVALRMGHADARQAEQVATEAAVDAHEEAAETFFWVSVACWSRPPAPWPCRPATFRSWARSSPRARWRQWH